MVDVDVAAVVEEIAENRGRRAEKVRENRLRRMAARQGLVLHKSRVRDPHALDYGAYWLTDDRNKGLVLGRVSGDWHAESADLDDIEAYLLRD